jgi:uncharacterized protein YoxC
VIDPLFWLGLSILLVAVSLTAVLIAALPALQELARAARSVEKLADTLRRELPPTLEAIRLTGLEISDLTDDVSVGVKSAGQVVKQVDQSINGAKSQAKKVQVNTRGMVAGVKAAWSTWNRPTTVRRGVERLPPSQRTALDILRDREDMDDLDSESAENAPESSLSETTPRQYENFEPSEETSEY